MIKKWANFNESNNEIDLSKCEKGDILISSQGSVFEYIAPTPWLHHTYLDHVVRRIKDTEGKIPPDNQFVTRTNDGYAYKNKRMPEFDEDIIQIIKREDYNDYDELGLI